MATCGEWFDSNANSSGPPQIPTPLLNDVLSNEDTISNPNLLQSYRRRFDGVIFTG